MSGGAVFHVREKGVVMTSRVPSDDSLPDTRKPFTLQGEVNLPLPISSPNFRISEFLRKFSKS